MTTNEIKSCCAASRSAIQIKTEDTINHHTSSHNQHQADDSLVKIPAGTFTLGTSPNDPDAILADGEAIRKTVTIESFLLSKYPVTNAQFQHFIDETGYVTDAERFGWSYVFHLFVHEKIEPDVIGTPASTPWWRAVKEANWRKPEGRFSSIEERLNHPVVHVSWNDAVAYANWANKRLPTEAEWEYAAAGGMTNQKFPWGQQLTENNRHHANVWQGSFPNENSAEDGFIGTAPVDAYEPNAFGLYTMIGNVWEWSADTFHTRHPNFKENDEFKLIKGGSYLCHASYCNRYRIAARTFNSADSSTGHMGFRLAANIV